MAYAVESIVRRSLHDELVERLRDIIVEGGLVAGQKVPEKELCSRIGVSRTPMREALKVLAVDGLITLIPNRGAVVRRLTRADLKEVFPVMGALEALSGELACEHVTDDEIAQIRQTHRQMVGHYRAGNLPEYFRCNQAIHEAILNAARNDTLAGQYRTLATRVRRARFLANMSAERWASAVAEHEQMLAALTERDGLRLAEILKQHLAKKFNAVLELLDSEAGV